MGIQTHVENLEPVTWALWAIAVILVVVRLVVRYRATHDLGLDDVLIAIALIMDTGSTASLSLAVKNGLGHHSETLTAAQNQHRYKVLYALHLLYIPIIYAAKLSLVVFFRRLAVKKIYHKATWVLAGLITAWAISAIFVIAFQCPLPHPWDPTLAPAGSCLSEKIWIYITAVDCISEAFIIALPFWIVWTVQIPMKKKIMIQALFSARVVVIAASIVQYAASKARPSNRGFDNAYDQTGYWLWTDLHCTITIIAACIPALKPFLEWSANHIGNFTGFPRSGGSSGNKYMDGSGTYKMRAYGTSRQSRTVNGAAPGTVGGGRGGFVDTAKSGGMGYQTRIEGVERNNSSDSVDTQASGAMIIKQTTEWNVDYDGGHGSPTVTVTSSRQDTERGLSGSGSVDREPYGVNAV